ncbi:MAG: MBL fold metallo-hydrolase [Candidatus Sungbacteria bacterium]|nr:MBL fold metallo-hydrolase [Candidatus Sungbacteria bacterium]
MIIKKFLHSCILLEEQGRRLLIDPGDMSFFEKKISPEDIGGADVIVFTHRHSDHLDLDILKKFLSLKQAKILAHEEIGKKLKESDIPYTSISAGETKIVEGFTIETIEAPHGHGLSVPSPYNLGFKIDNAFFHPGDCVSLENIETKVLALPVMGSWMRFPEAVLFAKRVKPQYVIPIHDALIGDVFIDRVYDYYRGPLEKDGISFYQLGLDNSLEI